MFFFAVNSSTFYKFSFRHSYSKVSRPAITAMAAIREGKVNIKENDFGVQDTLSYGYFLLSIHVFTTLMNTSFDLNSYS